MARVAGRVFALGGVLVAAAPSPPQLRGASPDDSVERGLRRQHEPCITEADIDATIEAFMGAVVSIGKLAQNCSAAKHAALGALNAAYAYDVPNVSVLFKPTLTEKPWVYRPTKELALSYFVGTCVCPGATTANETVACGEADGYFAPDFGFAFGLDNEGFSKVERGGVGAGGRSGTNFWYNVGGPFCHAALAQGPICFTAAGSGSVTCVDKTFGFVPNPDPKGALRVLLSTHHSSLQAASR
jgi:hypothetical protein